LPAARRCAAAPRQAIENGHDLRASAYVLCTMYIDSFFNLARRIRCAIPWRVADEQSAVQVA
jgi:hypothetical protein